MTALEKLIGEMWCAAPEIYKQLREATDLETARVGITNYLELRKRELRSFENEIHPLLWIVMDDCIDALRNIFSSRYEKTAGFSALGLLWNLAHSDKTKPVSDLNPGFVEEFKQLFEGIMGKADFYPASQLQEEALEGREAAIKRSAELDELAEYVEKKISRYLCALDEPLAGEYQKNIRRIKKYFKAGDEDWNDWQWQLRNVIHDRRVLENFLPLTKKEKQAIDLAAAKHVPFGITPYYAALISHKPAKTGIFSTRAQVIPPLEYVENMLKHKDEKEFVCDFMLERDTSPIDLITRRYPMIVILKPYNACFQVCVYCQRNWEISGTAWERDLFDREKVDAAIDWIAERPGIREILVTGGDPLALTDYQIAYILDRLSRIDHIDRIRIGTRTLVVAPMRITPELVDLLSRYHKPPHKELIIVTHFQHPAEITPEAFTAAKAFLSRGIKIYNQAVFTTANSRRFEICALRIALRRIGVDPYYLFNAKAKKEIPGYGVPIARLLQEFKEEARLLPGTVRTDSPVYNIPRLGKNYITAWQHHRLIMIMPDGRRLYEFHPWEKGISLTDVYVEADESIYDYLQYMKQMGENPEDYKSIWYYF